MLDGHIRWEKMFVEGRDDFIRAGGTGGRGLSEWGRRSHRRRTMRRLQMQGDKRQKKEQYDGDHEGIEWTGRARHWGQVQGGEEDMGQEG